MGNLSNKTIKCHKSIFENVHPYRIIEGVYIRYEWINHDEYPEPPSELEEPTKQSKFIYDRYRDELMRFSKKMLETPNKGGDDETT